MGWEMTSLFSRVRSKDRTSTNVLRSRVSPAQHPRAALCRAWARRGSSLRPFGCDKPEGWWTAWTQVTVKRVVLETQRTVASNSTNCRCILRAATGKALRHTTNVLAPSIAAGLRNTRRKPHRLPRSDEAALPALTSGRRPLPGNRRGHFRFRRARTPYGCCGPGRAGRADAGLGQTAAEPLVPVSAEALQLEWVGSEALRASEGLEDASRSRSSFPGGGHPAPGSPCCLLGRREGVGSKAAPEGDGGRRERERRLLHVLGRCRLELGVLDAVLRHPAGADHSVVQLPPLPAADADTWHLLQEQAWLALHGPLRAALLLLRVRPAHPPRHFLQLLRAARLRGMPEEGRPAFPLQGNRDEERRWSPQLYATPLDQRQCPALQPLHGVQAAVRHAAQALWLQVLRWRLAFCEKVCCHFCAVFTAVLLEHVATKTVWKNLKGKWVLVSNFTHRLRRRLLCLLVLLFAFLCHDTLATIWLHVD